MFAKKIVFGIFLCILIVGKCTCEASYNFIDTHVAKEKAKYKPNSYYEVAKMDYCSGTGSLEKWGELYGMSVYAYEKLINPPKVFGLNFDRLGLCWRVDRDQGAVLYIKPADTEIPCCYSWDLDVDRNTGEVRRSQILSEIRNTHVAKMLNISPYKCELISVCNSSGYIYGLDNHSDVLSLLSLRIEKLFIKREFLAKCIRDVVKRITSANADDFCLKNELNRAYPGMKISTNLPEVSEINCEIFTFDRKNCSAIQKYVNENCAFSYRESSVFDTSQWNRPQDSSHDRNEYYNEYTKELIKLPPCEEILVYDSKKEIWYAPENKEPYFDENKNLKKDFQPRYVNLKKLEIVFDVSIEIPRMGGKMDRKKIKIQTTYFGEENDNFILMNEEFVKGF